VPIIDKKFSSKLKFNESTVENFIFFLNKNNLKLVIADEIKINILIQAMV
jgi:hypothetical protein